MPEVPDSQKNCTQLGTAIEYVKEEILDRLPYSKIPSGENAFQEIATAMFVIAMTPKRVIENEIEDVKDLTKRYQELIGYSREKRCGYEKEEASEFLKKFESLGN